MLLLLALPAIIGLSFVLDVWGDDDDEQVSVNGEGPYVGTDAAEHIVGDGADNFIIGGGGSDTIDGGGGNDRIAGASGADNVSGQSGDDFLIGNGGNDILNGGAGNDIVEGGYGDDQINLGDGNDQTGVSSGFFDRLDSAYLEEGDDVIHGGAGDDYIWDGIGANEIFGGDGDDRILAADAATSASGVEDIVDGGNGDDSIIVDDGDTVTGGAGDDIIAITRYEATDADVVTVTDFNPAADTLQLLWKGTTEEDPELDYTNENNGVTLSFNGVYLAFLADVNSAQLAKANITLIANEDAIPYI